MISRDILDKWLADLRNPANQSLQGKGCLRSVDDKFCCLGRLANIIDPEGWSNVDPTAPAMWKHKKGRGKSPAVESTYEEPHDTFIHPDLIPGRVQERLASLNDGVGGCTNPGFAGVASVIEDMVASGLIPVSDDPG